MIRYLARALGAHFRSGRTLFALSVLGVALGVASVLSIQIINRNALGAFEGSVRAVSGEADFSVLGRAGDFSDALYPMVLADPAVADAWPIMRVDVALEGPGEAYLEVLGLDLFSAGRVPWRKAPKDPFAPLETPGWAAVSPELARERGWVVGDRFEVSSGSRRAELSVGALVDFRRVSPLASTRMVVMDIARAQDALGRRGILQQIDVRLRRGADAEAARSRIASSLGTSVELLTPDQRRRQASGLLGAFRLNLTALSLVSLFVGGFLIHASVEASLLRRRNELGLLRSVGSTRGQVLSLVLVEVAILGALGVAIGLPLGYAVAARNVELVSSTLTNLYMLEEIRTLALPPWLWLLAAGVGIGGAVAGALAPALDVSRRDPSELLAAYTLHEKAGRGAARTALLGCATILAGLAIWLGPARDWRPGGFLLAVALLTGLPLMTPWAVRLATGRLPARGFGLSYGIKALGRRLRATSFAVAALAVAVSMLVGITLMIGSFRRTVEIWIDGTLRADVYVTSESWRRARSAATLDDGLVRDIGTTPGVIAVDRLRQVLARADGRRVSLIGVDMRLPGAQDRFAFYRGDPAEAMRRAHDEGAVLISEPLARKAGLGVGDVLRVPGPAGEVAFAIAGIFYDYGNESGTAAMDLDTMAAAFGPGPINNVALYLDDGVDPEAAVDRLKRRFGELPLIIRSNRDLRAEVVRIFDQTFAVTRLLQAISLLIAVAGITLTLIVMARERVSELALYRALGAARRQVFGVFLGKGLGMALFGLAMGVGGGLALAMILILVINPAYFGWTIAFHWPWAALAQQVATILAASVLASLYPALRASRTPATELSRENL